MEKIFLKQSFVQELQRYFCVFLYNFQERAPSSGNFCNYFDRSFSRFISASNGRFKEVKHYGGSVHLVWMNEDKCFPMSSPDKKKHIHDRKGSKNLLEMCRFCTQFAMLHSVCNLHSVCSFTLSVWFHTRCVVLHSVFSLTQKCVWAQ